MRYKEEVSSFQPPAPPPFYVFYDAPLPNKLLRCLESIRSNIPLLKTSWLFLEGRRVKRDWGWGWGGEEGPQGGDGLAFPFLLKAERWGSNAQDKQLSGAKAAKLN